MQDSDLACDLGVATASTQFFRNVASTVGITAFGTVMTSGLAAVPADGSERVDDERVIRVG